MKWVPKPYQNEVLPHAIEQPRIQLWLDKGLGKTVVAATAVQEKMERLLVSRTLVVSTKRIIEDVWPAELAKWDHLRDLPHRTIEGSSQARRRMLDSDWHGIELINFEKLIWLFQTYLGQYRRDLVGNLPWQQIIFDESSKLKNPGTRRFRLMRRHAPSFPHVMHLTGSPAPSGLLNLWGPAYFLDCGERLGRTYTTYQNREGEVHQGFRETFFEQDGYNAWQWLPKDGAEDDIIERLSDVTISMRAQDYLDMPPLVVNDIWVDLPASCRALYNKMEDEMFLHLEQGTVEVANAGVLTGKCRQVANGALYLDGGTGNWQELHKEKLEAFDEVVAEQDTLIGAYQFKFDLAHLRKKYPHASFFSSTEKGGENVVTRWNAGKIPLLLLNPASAGHGLNLQDGGNHMAFFGCPWSYDQYDQAVDRIAGGLRRQRPTFIHRILCRNTIDEDIVQVLAGHGTLQDVLKERMKNRRRLKLVS